MDFSSFSEKGFTSSGSTGFNNGVPKPRPARKIVEFHRRPPIITSIVTTPATNPTFVTPNKTSSSATPFTGTGTDLRRTTSSKILAQAEEDLKRDATRESSKLQLIEVSRIQKGIPQSPHFLPLRGFSQLTRKHLISGCDRLFEETVNRTCGLRRGNFRINACELWTTLGELQSLGYDVLPLRRRVVELSDVTVEVILLRNKVSGLRHKAERHRIENSRLESEILSLKAKAEREQIHADDVVKLVGEIEEELLTFNDGLANFALKPLVAQNDAL